MAPPRSRLIRPGWVRRGGGPRPGAGPMLHAIVNPQPWCVQLTAPPRARRHELPEAPRHDPCRDGDTGGTTPLWRSSSAWLSEPGVVPLGRHVVHQLTQSLGVGDLYSICLRAPTSWSSPAPGLPRGKLELSPISPHSRTVTRSPTTPSPSRPHSPTPGPGACGPRRDPIVPVGAVPLRRSGSPIHWSLRTRPR